MEYATLNLESAGSVGHYVAAKRSSWNPSLWRSWVDTCVNGHELCNATPTTTQKRYIPTRVIDVNPDLELPRLVEPCNEVGEYVAFSHCWGGSLPLRTTSENYSGHLSGLSWNKLPKSFQDVIMVTRAIGYQYVWIDCLCIIQDSEEDWLRECALMDKVYASATVTIAASESDSPEQGLFMSSGRPRNVCSLSVSWPRKKVSDTLTLHLPLRPYAHSPDAILSGPLSNRAWAFQERFLSPRVLHISDDRTYFECLCSENTDCLPWPMPPDEYAYKRILSVHQDPLTFLKDWYCLIVNYTSRRMTNGRDRLPAVSGVARTISARLQWTFVAGLWSHDLAVGLLWHTSDPIEPLAVHPARYSGPSWSWASLDRPIGYFPPYWLDKRHPYGRLQDRHTINSLESYDWLPCLDIQHWEVDGVNEDPFAEVISGQLTVVGKICSVVLEFSRRAYPEKAVSALPGTFIPMNYHPDRDEASAVFNSPRECQCLLVGFSKIYSTNVPTGYGIVIEQVPGTTASFRRIGLMRFGRSQEDDETATSWDKTVDCLLATNPQQICLV